MKDWRDSKEYRRWQDAVIAKDGKCQTPGCSSTKGLEAHHTNHASFFPEDRYNVKKGKALCGYCHRQYHCNYHSSTKAKCTEADWLNFWALMQYALSLHKYPDTGPFLKPAYPDKYLVPDGEHT